MIKFLTAYTRELDNPEKAVMEIHAQLNLEKELLANSVALIFCHTDFIASGVMEAVSLSLPFEALGCTSQYFAVSTGKHSENNFAADEMLMTVTAITSDNIKFASGISQPLNENNIAADIKNIYKELTDSLDEKPSIAFAFQPILTTITGDTIVSVLDYVCGGIPVFGTCAMDADINIRNPKVIYRGVSYNDRIALLLFCGDVKPRFFSALFPEKSAITQDAVITAAEGNRITRINNQPALFFAEELGISQNGALSFLDTLPLLVDYNNGETPEIVLIHEIGRNGALVCTRNIRKGGVIKIGSITADYILGSANILVDAIKKEKQDNTAGLFIFSCFSRIMALGGNPMEEIKLIQKELEDFPAPYLFLYSGGEICPKYNKQEKITNKFHQYAIIACMFQGNNR